MAECETGLAGGEPVQPHSSRVYDYLLGGKNNYAVDRAIGDRIIASVPTVRTGVRAQRGLLGRVVRYLVGDAGIRQLIDIGSGLPTAENVHQIAQRIDPLVRVVYVDNDQVVLTHARALLADEVTTIAVAGDLRDPRALLGDSAIREHLDFGQPIGLLLCGILHYIPDSDKPRDIIRALREELPAGSYIFIHHMLESDDPAARQLKASIQAGAERMRFRSRDEIEVLFEGLELVEPGLVFVPDWRPDPNTLTIKEAQVLSLAVAGVGRKP